MSDLWVPGAAGPLDQFVERLQRRVAAFGERHSLEEVAVEFELADGAIFSARAISAEPGFGFVTITPHPEPDEEEEDVIVPIGAIRQITLGRPEPARARFGFSPG